MQVTFSNDDNKYICFKVNYKFWEENIAFDPQ